jgi:hypothetical protein
MPHKRKTARKCFFSTNCVFDLLHIPIAQLPALARIELAGRSFASVLWAPVECDFRARCCLMDGVDHDLE